MLYIATSLSKIVNYFTKPKKYFSYFLGKGAGEETLENKEKKLKQQFEYETYKIDHQYQKIINKLEKENNYLKKVIDRFRITVQKFITWICHKFSYPSEDDLIRNFEKETYTNFNIEKQLDINKFEKREKEDELEYF